MVERRNRGGEEPVEKKKNNKNDTDIPESVN